MSWFRRHRTPEVPPLLIEPLDVPTDLSSGSEAREQALARLRDVVADEQASMLSRVLDRIVQENHIREYLQNAHGRS